MKLPPQTVTQHVIRGAQPHCSLLICVAPLQLNPWCTVLFDLRWYDDAAWISLRQEPFGKYTKWHLLYLPLVTIGAKLAASLA